MCVKSITCHRDALVLKLGNFEYRVNQLETVDKLMSDIRIVIDLSEQSFATMFEDVRGVGWSATSNVSVEMSELNNTTDSRDAIKAS